MYSSIKRESKYDNYYATKEAVAEKSLCKHVIKHRKQNAMYKRVMRVVFRFVLFNSQTVRPIDTDKVDNLAQHPKSLGTAALDHNF